ncbi:hypothetical protein GGP41_002310 [Bipolaris sorokiniana]|uniref:Uncharacterized protein n=2 Tax=Cochliobolus sativus TaxID=45130 RepID=A0A8H6DW28_COCSA|nr:uncharacterized protein COCSADRAFT_201724 [Bipolaris sorokiniana ND90Pr]EMD62238.1 hypothetical protein COCSADRAFT_201724 [Bipolaris sorokiniana ND90Pr]KAF5850053.1 hypothetical protein GGP41_002310 [Bipolaris sorokiniana]
MRFTAATFVLATAVLPHASAWTVWVNWKSQCGGASYRVDGTGSSPCQLTNIPADQKKPISLTFTNGRGCVGYIYSDRNCGAQVGGAVGSVGAACSADVPFQSWNVICS